MKKGFLFLLLLLLGWTTLLPAQKGNSNDYQDGILLEQIDVSNSSIIQGPQGISVNPLELGFQQVMEQLRERVANAESENYLEISQKGSNNSATLVQEGRRNSMEIDQKGNSNTYQGTLSGEDNLLQILQTGSFNETYQILSGNGMELQVIQEGSFHELIQIESTTNGPTPRYQIHQKGNGMKLRIEHGIADFPFGNQ